jgi:transposase
MAIVTLGIDLAKNVFAMPQAAPCWFAPACPAASCWNWLPRCRPAWSAWRPAPGRTIGRAYSRPHGHTVRLMAPKFVSPYRMSGKRGKNDAADALAICEAVTRPNMRFVPSKSLEQQSQLLVHRARQGFVAQHVSDHNGPDIDARHFLVLGD